MTASRKPRLGVAPLVLAILTGCQDSGGPQAVTAPPGGVVAPAAEPAGARVMPSAAKKTSRGRSVQGQAPLPRPGA